MGGLLDIVGGHVCDLLRDRGDLLGKPEERARPDEMDRVLGVVSNGSEVPQIPSLGFLDLFFGGSSLPELANELERRLNEQWRLLVLYRGPEIADSAVFEGVVSGECVVRQTPLFTDDTMDPRAQAVVQDPV